MPALPGKWYSPEDGSNRLYGCGNRYAGRFEESRKIIVKNILMKFRNFKMVDYVVYGRGCFDQLDEIIAPKRKEAAPMIFLLDHFFANNSAFKARIPLKGNDKLLIADVTYEPK